MPTQLIEASKIFVERLTLQATAHYCYHDAWPETSKHDQETAQHLLRDLSKLRSKSGDSETLRALMSTLKQIHNNAIDAVLVTYFDSKDAKRSFSTFAERDRAYIATQYLQKDGTSRSNTYLKTFAINDRLFMQSLLDTLTHELNHHHLSRAELTDCIVREILAGSTPALQAMRLQRWIETLNLAWPTHRHIAEILYQSLLHTISATTALKYVAEPQQEFFKHFSGELLQHPQHSDFSHKHHPADTITSNPSILAELLPGRHLGNPIDNELLQRIHSLLDHETGIETIAEVIHTLFRSQMAHINTPTTAELYQPIIFIPEQAVKVLAPDSNEIPIVTATVVSATTATARIQPAQATTESLFQPFDSLSTRLQHLITASLLQDSLVQTSFLRVDQWLQVAEFLRHQEKYYEANVIVSSLRIGLADFMQEPFLPKDLKHDLKPHSKKAFAYDDMPPGDPSLIDTAAALATQIMALDQTKLQLSLAERRQQLLQLDRCAHWRECLKNPALIEWLREHPHALKNQARDKHFKAFRACSTHRVETNEFRAILSQLIDTTELSKAAFDDIYRHSKQMYYHHSLANPVLRDLLKTMYLSKQGLKIELFHQSTEQQIQYINQATQLPQSDEVFQNRLASIGIVLTEKLLQLVQRENRRLQRAHKELETHPVHQHHSTCYDLNQIPTRVSASLLSSTASESEAEEHHDRLKNDSPLTVSEDISCHD